MRLVVRLMTGVALLALAPRAAFAHAALLRTTPAANSHLAAAPAQVALLFSEPLEVSLASLTLVGPDDASIPLTAAGDPHDVHRLIASLPGGVAAGRWRIRYHVVSADGHPVNGEFAFTVGAASASPPASAAPASAAQADAAAHPADEPQAAATPDFPPAAALLRGIAMALLMALGGTLWFFAVPGQPRDRAPSGAWRLLLTLAVLAALFLAAHLAAWTMHVAPAHRLDAATIGGAIASATGRVELWRTALALLALWALALGRRPRIALAFTVAALAVSGAIGHSAAIASEWTIPARALHLLAGAAWMGGLLWLVILAISADAATLTSEAHRVSRVALVSIIVVAISGLVQGLFFLPNVAALFHTTYGLVLLAKVAVLLVLFGFGAYHRQRVLPRIGSEGGAPGFRTSLRAELAVMCLAALLGGALAYLPPDAHDAPAPTHLTTP